MFSNEKILLQAEIIVIGNEVVSGLIQDTNGRFLSHQLHLLGINVARITVVADDEGSISSAIEEALVRVDIVIVTGGLGSTHDDITKGVLALVFNSDMIHDHKVMDMLEVKFKERHQEVPKRVRSQSEIPEAAVVLYNEKGTAPGFLFERNGKKLFSLPGVPSEMEHLFWKYVSPDLKKLKKGVIGHRVIKTVGLTEASLWEKFGSIESLERLVAVASLPSYMGVKIRLSHCSKSSEEIEIRLQKAEDMVMKVVGKWVYGKDDDTLEGRVGRMLRDRSLTLAVAESCTGGLIGHRLTQEPGSSNYFVEGAVVYSNESKIGRLKVPSSLIQEYGAVSKEVALAMAGGIREVSGADVGLSVTGMAGPGSSENKPAGIVFIAISDKNKSYSEFFRFYDNRTRNKERSAQAALDLLRRWLLKII